VAGVVPIELLPWERLLWSGRPLPPGSEHYAITDFRVVRLVGGRTDELLLQDIADVQRTETFLERLTGTSTIVVQARDSHRPPIVLRRLRRGAQLAALIELVSGQAQASLDAATVHATLCWEPRIDPGIYRAAFASVCAVLVALTIAAIGLHGSAASVSYPADDAIYPNGAKRSRAEIVAFMEQAVMPWARDALGPIVGGAHRVTCATCHGASAGGRDWQMPAVAALPEPDFADGGWESYSASMDPQTRNAIYGYVAEADNQTKAAYMREVVMPGMARLLHRPTYDFTRPYDYNRTRLAFGCYHCHRVK
jgi:hypothetical protein